MAKSSRKAFTCQWYGQEALVAIECPKGSKTEGKFAIHCKCVGCQRRRLGYAREAEIEAMLAANPTMPVKRNGDTDDAWNDLFEIVPDLQVNEPALRISSIGPVIGSSPFRQAKN